MGGRRVCILCVGKRDADFVEPDSVEDFECLSHSNEIGGVEEV